MKRNIRLVIAFDGTAYNGWQRQKNGPTIQGTLERKLSVLCCESVCIHGAGRTDAGVHALGMVAHFKTGAVRPLSAFTRGLNSMLPHDIRILEACEMPSDFHSRYHALAKTYRYDLFTGDVMPPTRRLYEAHLPGSFDLTACRRSLLLLMGSHDFASFEGAGSRDPLRKDGRGAVRTIFQARCSPISGQPNRWSFSITGDGFLRHMVRNIVGTLRQVGMGIISPDDFAAIVAACDRHQAGPTAPACGLFLEQIYYNRQDIPVLQDTP
ncbi:MAG TPA: tRNA pseudouridine(38-40) synthase TruA [Desulfobulbus sp.]|nr:tRNA pseudouridine(38-40) synthase TruA [Desulfobulbus sp.]